MQVEKDHAKEAFYQDAEMANALYGSDFPGFVYNCLLLLLFKGPET